MKVIHQINTVVLAIALLTLPQSVAAIDPDPDALFVRVIDCGAGLACVVKMPGANGDDYYMIYDTGHWNTDNKVLEAVQEIIPDGEEIDLLVLSHSDSDHLGACDEILDAYRVHRVLRTGLKRSTSTWKDADEAIKLERANEGCIDINLSYFEYPSGATYRFGDTFVTMVCGFGSPPSDWDLNSTSEKRNAVSIVIRLLFEGKSILFTGDAVGRHIGDPSDALIATEKFMIEMSPVVEIDSDVLIAPHHGADNGSSTAFIEAVSPEFVVFSAGHAHEHPRMSAAQRYLDAGIDINNILRTDRGDNEGSKEWPHGSRLQGKIRNNDDIDIQIKSDGSLVVSYRIP